MLVRRPLIYCIHNFCIPALTKPYSSSFIAVRCTCVRFSCSFCHRHTFCTRHWISGCTQPWVLQLCGKDWSIILAYQALPMEFLPPFQILLSKLLGFQCPELKSSLIKDLLLSCIHVPDRKMGSSLRGKRGNPRTSEMVYCVNLLPVRISKPPSLLSKPFIGANPNISKAS